MQNFLIHGLGQDKTSWDVCIKNINNVEKTNCPDLSLLLKDKNLPATYDNLYHAFYEGLEKINEPLNLCGISLGAILAMQYAIDNPSKVNCMILIAGQYEMPKTMLKIQNMIFHFMPNATFKKMGFSKKNFISLSKSMMDLNFKVELNAIKCPVLVLCGEFDKQNKKASKYIASVIEGAKYKDVKGAGHEVNMERPLILGKIINDFFSKHQ